MAGDEVSPDDHDCDAGWAYVLLGASVDNAILGPVNRLGHEVARHVGDENLAFRHLVKWEVLELKALDGLVVTVVEVLCVGGHVPISRLGNGLVSVALVVGNFVCVAVFLGLFDGALGPCA